MKRAPKHKRRHSGKRRVDTADSNRNRLVVKANGRGSLTTGTARIDFRVSERDCGQSALLDDHVTLISRRSERVLVSVIASQFRRLEHVAKTRDVSLDVIDDECGVIVAEARGNDLASFLRHCAGVRRMDSFRTWLAEIPEASTGTDSHHRYCIEHGLSDMPKRIDYSAGRNQPKASYAIDGRYSANDRDHTDTRNDNERAGEYAPRVAHTEH